MKNFADFDLIAPLKQAIAELGFETPTPIQAAALPVLLAEPTDFIGLAATGTGKTAVFGLPLLQRLDSATRGVQAIVLCPTRELAVQVCGQINLMGKHLGVRALPVYGGASYGDQISGLRRGASVVVGTPGRVVDLMERAMLDLGEVRTVVLDEADKMISMGFKEELEKILEQSPRESSNIWLFSATMSREVRKVADQYLRDPKQIQVNQDEMLSSTVEQSFYATSEANKPEVLCKLIDAADDFFGLVFCQTKALVADLTQYLQQRGYRVDCLHGDMEQHARTRVMQAFRDHKVTILICTDVASRGLDVQGITHVINYSIPREIEHYVHRIGRTARSGKAGFAMSLLTPSHRGLLRRIEQVTRSKITEGKIPGRKEIGAKKVAGVLKDFENQTNPERALEVMSDAWKEKLAGMSVDQVASRFLSMMFPEIFATREQAAPTVAPKRAKNPVKIQIGAGSRPVVTPSSSAPRPIAIKPRAAPKPVSKPAAVKPHSKVVVRPKTVPASKSGPAPQRENPPPKETRRERRAKLFGHLSTARAPGEANSDS